MPVRVCHTSTDLNSKTAKFTNHESDSCTIEDGHLIVGDSKDLANNYTVPSSFEAVYAPGAWFNAIITEDDDESDSDDED